MTKPKRAHRYVTDVADAELRKLRLRVEQLQDQVRKERRRGNQLEEELAFVRQQQVELARRGLNGVAA